VTTGIDPLFGVAHDEYNQISPLRRDHRSFSMNAFDEWLRQAQTLPLPRNIYAFPASRVNLNCFSVQISAAAPTL